VLIGVGLVGDWLLVVATVTEFLLWLTGVIRQILPKHVLRWNLRVAPEVLVVAVVLGLGLWFLSRHDTESGHIPLLAALAVVGLAARPRGKRFLDRLAANWVRSVKIPVVLGAGAWLIPGLAILAGLIPENHPLARRSEVHALIDRCRFSEVPADDVERLARWCRFNTPEDAQFVGPPGPKTFRLWSRRALAFNRSASPYHAAGLADWFRRFRDHVGFSGTASEFVQSYVRDRHGIEARYQALDSTERTQLAIRQGASYLVAAAPKSAESADPEQPLEVLHVEGRYAVYRVRPEAKTDQLARSVVGDQRQR
jgi:hypothetical protein